MSKLITTDTTREQEVETFALSKVMMCETSEQCARELGILIEACPPPLHRWFSSPLHRVMALAIDDVMASGSEPSADAITGCMAATSHSDAIDRLKGRLVTAKTCSHEDSALAHLGGWNAVSDMHEQAAATAIIGGLAAAVKYLRHAGDRRQILEALREVATAVAGSDLIAGPYAALQGAQSRLNAVSGVTGERNLGDHLGTALREGEQSAIRREQGHHLRATWGIAALDNLVPMRPGTLMILAAAPGCGKTSLALQSIVANAVDGGFGTAAVCSLEMRGSELASIVAAREVGISRAALEEHLPEVPQDAWQRLDEIAEQWRVSAGILVRDNAAGGKQTTVESVVAWLTQRRSAAPGMRLGVLDYLQLLESTNPRSTEYERISNSTRALKRAAVNLHLPLLVLSQLNRAGRAQIKDRSGRVVADPEPTLADLRGSGSIEQDADAVVFLHAIGAPDLSAPTILIRATVAKNRAGRCGSIDLWFHRRQQIFEEARASGINVSAAKVRLARMSSSPCASEGAGFT